jgi:hypothetical protein
MMFFRTAAVCVISLVFGADSAFAQVGQDAPGARFGFWVIGPNAQARGWASQWIEEALRDAPNRPRGSVVDWRMVLSECLDADAAPLGPPPPDRNAGGPHASEFASLIAVWPWDMTEPMSLEEMVVRRREGRLTFLVQVVARAVPADLDSRDSVWVLDAVAIGARLGETPGRHGVVLATSRGVSHRSLITASRTLGLQLADVWAQLTPADSTRAR